MKKYISFVLLCLICCFIACSKTSENGVLIRVENNTSQDFKEVFTYNKSFTNVKAFSVTSYEGFDKAGWLAWARLINTNNDTTFVGSIMSAAAYTYLPDGKYTLKITMDTTAYYGHNCFYIKN